MLHVEYKDVLGGHVLNIRVDQSSDDADEKSSDGQVKLTNNDLNMMDGDKFKPSWKQLISEHPDRFIFAMDNVWAFQWQDTYLRHIKVWRSALADLPPDVANAVAHGNAEKLWKLAPKP